MTHDAAPTTSTLPPYFDPRVLANLHGLELRARMVVEGFYAGMHHSPHHGLSIEFADHRAYTQGDDLKHIDWKVFAKTDKYYIKEYEQETNMHVLFVVDCSASMNYRSSEAFLSKYEYATVATGAIAHLALRQRDYVGLALFDEHITEYIKPSVRHHHWHTLVRAMSNHERTGGTSLGATLAELGERLSQRTLVIVISDLFDDPERIVKGLTQLRYRRHEPVVWNLWDQAELTFPFDGTVLFEGLEQSGELVAEPDAIRRQYLEEVHRFQNDMRTMCGRQHISYSVFDTSQPLSVSLTSYLAARSNRLRQRSSRVLR